MTNLGDGSWLAALRTPNADVARFNEVLDAYGLRVTMRLDALADVWLAPDGGPRSVLLVAHAGDGKTEFLRHLARLAPPQRLKTFDLESPTPTWSAAGWWILNDPSQLPTTRVIEFLSRAFSMSATGSRFVAAINRGLLRAVVQREACDDVSPDAWREARAWLRRALDYQANAVDEHGRIAVPLDRRVLVPGPGDTRSAAGDVAFAVLARVRAQTGGAWDACWWSACVARVLSLVEASGHHVTFREVLALSAAVAEALGRGKPHDALGVLFMAPAAEASPSLKPLESVLRRLDPAKVPSLAIDVDTHAPAERDARVRGDALKNLASAFAADGVAEGLPYRHAGVFLRVCRSVTDGGADVPAARRAVFRGLSRVAWGAHSAGDDLDVLPLTSPVHPGALAGGTRTLRAALSVESSCFVADATAHGDYIERGLTLPALVMRRHAGDADAPRLRLDLELFDMLARLGSDEHGTVAWLGPRAAQVLAWFDALVAHWERDLSVASSSGLVSFQTILGAPRPVALRPSPEGGGATLQAALTPAPDDVLAALQRALALDDKVMITPSACAAALLRWAGFTSLAPAGDGKVDATEREAMGASSVPRVMRFKRLAWPAFPWSSHTLGVAVAHDDRVLAKGGAWDRLAPELGAACAKALGLYDGDPEAWRRALRSAWADDEECFDTHPSGRLAHQRLAVGVSGRQLAGHAGASIPSGSGVRTGVVSDLLATSEALPFSRPSRWWLLGIWASWWLMLEGLRAAHGHPTTPALLPCVGDPRGAREYQSVREAWFLAPARLEKLAAVQALAQGAGWCTPPGATKNFDLLLDGPILDVVRLVAWRVQREGEGRPDQRTLSRLQDALLDAGLYARLPGKAITDRVPPGALPFSSPDSKAFDSALRATLQRLAMLDAASDGATLFNSPWGRGADR